MEAILSLLTEHNTADIRSSLYYLGRYIKQADIFDKYEKDIFEDSIESAPSELVKQLTLRLIEIIEKIAGKKAAEFNKSEFSYWMDIINEIEDNIDPALTDTEKKRATLIIAQFEKLD